MLQGITWLLLHSGLAHAGDDLVRLAILPVDDRQSAEKVEAALPDGFVAVPLTEDQRALHQQNTTCRELPSCVAAHTPANVDLVLDLSLVPVSDAIRYDLRFLRNGELVNRRSQRIDPSSLWTTVEKELDQVLRDWRRDARLYALIDHDKHGETARQTLRERFPESPFTLALSERGRQQ
ncbi:MAG: hypothetical protein QGG40_04215 [Myxococcota bacterium]|nr:hypothetical protein [Myxococcota bacterium]